MMNILTKKGNDMEKVWTVEEIKEKLESGNRKWIERSVVAIFEKNQTFDERSMEHTKYRNGIGFNGCDANILSSFAKQIIRGRHLSDKQFNIACKKIPKYAKQLCTIANKGE